MTFFNEFAFFHAYSNQSKVEDSFQLASDWIKSAQKNFNKLKAVALLGSLLLVSERVFLHEDINQNCSKGRFLICLTSH